MARHAVGSRKVRAGVYGLLLAVQVGVALAFLLDRSPGTASAALGLPLDDGWIHLVYARSLSAFEGFAYNPGQQEAGFTSPLWELLLAPLFWIRVPWDVSLVVAVKCVGVLTAWGASIFACRLGARLAGLGAGVLLGLLVALDPWLAFGAVSGMEVPLAAATMLAGFDFLVAGRWRGAGVALGLSVWSRPECVVVAALAVGVTAWMRRGEGADRRPVRELALAPVAAGALWVIWCVAITGHLLPSAFYVKHQPNGLLDAFADAGAVFGAQLFDYPWFFLGSGVVAFFLGALRILREREHREARIALVAAGPVWLLAITWAHRMNEPLSFYWHRYLDPGLPLLLAPGAVGCWVALRTAVRLARGEAPRAGRNLALAALALPLLALPAVALPGKLARNAALQAWSAENVQDLHVRLGDWLRRHTDPTDRIATHDAGAIRFVSDRRVIDMLGINHRQVLLGDLPAVFRERPPRYIVVIPAWYPDLVRDPRLREVHRVRAEHFVICEQCEQDEMVVLEPASRTP